VPVEITRIRDILMPGLIEATERYSFAWTDIRSIYGTDLWVPEKPHIWVPKLTLPEAVAVGAAAAIIKNPVVTRRFWQGWLS
jgi:hypothetical protein